MFDVTLNGIDANGEHPPEEIVYDEDGQRLEVVHVAKSHAEWELRVYKPSGAHHKHFYGNLGEALGQLAAKAHANQEVPA